MKSNHVYDRGRVWYYNELIDDGDVVQDVVMNKTEEDILKDYWDYWSSRMKSHGKPESDINRENCIEDWIHVYWAWSDSNDNIVLGEN
jgi:hypothetical protein